MTSAANGASDEAARARVRLARALWGAVVFLGAAGLACEVAHYRWLRPWFRPFVAFFSLSFEHNLPTWYASSLLLGCALSLHAVAATVRRAPRTQSKHPRRWGFLAWLFALFSLDEAVSLHEELGRILRLRGVLYFSWVVPAAVLVAVFGLVYLPFVRALPRPTRARFVVAGLLYVGGALVMELPLGWWTERHGDENLGYALLDWVEEMLELVGATGFLLAVREHHALLRAAKAEPAREPG